MKKLFGVLVLLVLSAGVLLADGKPNPPDSLVVTHGPGGSALLQWLPSDGAAGYRIYKMVDTFPQVARIGQEMGTHFEDVIVPPGHTYRYYVTAFNMMGESGPSNDVTFVPGPPDSVPPQPRAGFISGTITDDSSGTPIPDVRVRFFRTNGFMFFREAHTDSLGRYLAPLDTGLYFIFATKWQYVPEWYDNAIGLDSATRVHVATGDTSVANFGLQHLLPPPPPAFLTVTGTVNQVGPDSGSTMPLPGAFVIALRTGRELADIEDQDGGMLGSRNEQFFMPECGDMRGVLMITRTDSAGKYSLKLPGGRPYVFFSAKTSFIPQFFDHKLTLEDANVIVLNSDTGGINFDLMKNPLLQNSISGQVKAGDGTGVPSRVVLISVNPMSMRMMTYAVPVRYTMTDSLGNYQFNNLLPSSNTNKYYIKAYPFPAYAPAWYTVDSCGVKEWANADSIVVNGNVTGINVCVVPVPPEGLAILAGTVHDQAGQAAMQGVTLYAVSQTDGSVAGYDVSASDGSFSISNLAPGSYSIVADKEGYQAGSSPVYSVTAATSYSVGNIQIGLTQAVLGVKPGTGLTPQAYVLRQNYPNPFNPTTEISFGLPAASHVTVTIFNLLGQQVAALVSRDFQAGNFSVAWNGTDAAGHSAASGIYFYRMTARALDNSAQFSTVRKMVLMK